MKLPRFENTVTFMVSGLQNKYIPVYKIKRDGASMCGASRFFSGMKVESWL